MKRIPGLAIILLAGFILIGCGGGGGNGGGDIGGNDPFGNEYSGHWKSKDMVLGIGSQYYGSTDEFYIDINVNNDGDFNGFGGIYIGITPLTCLPGFCTWSCGWIDSPDNRIPVSGYIDDIRDSGVIRIEGFDGEQPFVIVKDDDKPDKITLELGNTDWGIKKFVIYNPDYVPSGSGQTHALEGMYVGIFTSNSYTLSGTYEARLDFLDGENGTLTVDGVPEDYYSGPVFVESTTETGIVIVFEDIDGDEIKAELDREGDVLEGTWRYTDPRYDASGEIRVEKSLGA